MTQHRAEKNNTTTGRATITTLLVFVAHSVLHGIEACQVDIVPGSQRYKTTLLVFVAHSILPEKETCLVYVAPDRQPSKQLYSFSWRIMFCLVETFLNKKSETHMPLVSASTHPCMREEMVSLHPPADATADDLAHRSHPPRWAS